MKSPLHSLSKNNIWGGTSQHHYEKYRFFSEIPQKQKKEANYPEFSFSFLKTFSH